jgi:hypothetical protein
MELLANSIQFIRSVEGVEAVQNPRLPGPNLPHAAKGLFP